jgi:hypothetical protein
MTSDDSRMIEESSKQKKLVQRIGKARNQRKLVFN